MDFLKKGVVIGCSVLFVVGATACNKNKTVNTACLHTQTHSVTVKEATCTESGLEQTVCNSCKEILSENETEAIGHEFGEWTLVTEASCSEYGKTERVCVRGCKEYDDVDKLAHTPDENGKCGVCTQMVFSVGLKYTLISDGEGYSVALGDAVDKDIVIPAEWNGKPVTEIAAEGFAYSATLTSVTVPESIKKINSGAFNGSNSLQTVYWNAVSCADFADRNWAFLRADTAAELSVVFGRSVKHIPARMFFPLYNDTSRVPNVKSVTFEEKGKLESIGDYAFYQTPIEEIALPDGVKSIGGYAFAGTALKEFRAVGLTEIGDFAFCNCQALVSVELGGEISSFGVSAFDYCVNLENVELSKINGELGESLFKNCQKLSTVVFADGVTKIPARAFYGCKKLQSANVPDSVKVIGAEAFLECENVLSVTIGKGVERIENRAFAGLEKVAELYYNAANVQDFESGNEIFLSLGKKTSGVKVVLGDGVSVLPARFLFSSADADSLPKVTEITLNAALSKIGEYAFFGATCSVVYKGGAEAWQAVVKGAHNDALSKVSFGGES